MRWRLNRNLIHGLGVARVLLRRVAAGPVETGRVRRDVVRAPVVERLVEVARVCALQEARGPACG